MKIPLSLRTACLVLGLSAIFPIYSTHGDNVSVFATGLNNPRGLKFGPDGDLYVAEGGFGGVNSTVGQCAQVPGPSWAGAVHR